MIENSPKLISDVPANLDEFEVHERIAKALSSIVEFDKGGKTISLEGEWGSGKSTIINLLIDKLKSNKNIKIVVFDAWSHSGDPLRRAFLENLIDKLTDEKWLTTPDDSHYINYPNSFSNSKSEKEKPYWQKKKDELSGKLKHTSKTTTPKFKTVGLIFIGSLITLPVATTIFSNLIIAYLRNTWLFTFEVYLKWLCIISGILVLIPFIIFISSLIKSKDKSQFLNILLNRTVDEVETSTTDTIEPSSIEFQQLFCEAMDFSLKQDNRKLVIVIDNLDRLSKEAAESVWSMLRSFVDDSVLSSNKYKWVDKLWVIVPIATNSEILKGNFTAHEQDKKNVQSRTEQFLEKVFQVRFHLPAPVLENWHNYLQNLLVVAFGPEVKSEYKVICRLYEAHLETESIGDVLSPSKRPTPRSLKHFINDLVIVKILWKGSFSLPTLAAYVINTKNKNILEGLIKKTIPTKETIAIIGQEAMRDFPALYFNVEDVAKAQELLLRPLVNEYLMTGNGRKLINDLKINPYLETILRIQLSATVEACIGNNYDYDKVFSPIICLGETFENNQDVMDIYRFSDHTLEVMIKESIKIWSSLSYLPFEYEHLDEAIKKSIQVANSLKSNDITEIILETLKSTHKYSGDSLDINSNDWWGNLKTICEIPELHKLLTASDDNSVLLNIPANKLSEFYKTFGDSSDLTIYNKIYTSEPLQSVVQHFISVVSKKSLNYEDYKYFIRVINYKDYELFDNLLFNIKNSFSSGTTANELDHFDVLVSLLIDLRSVEKYNNTLNELVSSGHIHNLYYYAASNAEHLQLSSICLVAISLLSIPPGTITTFASSEDGKRLIKSLYDSPENHESIITAFVDEITRIKFYRLIIDIGLKDPSSTKFISTVFNKLEDKSILNSHFKNEINLSEVFKFSNKLPSSIQYRGQVVRYFMLENQLCTRLMNEKFKSENDWLYYSIILNLDLLNTSFINKIEEYLLSKSHTTWLNSISESTYLTLLTQSYIRSGNKILLGKEVFTAINSYHDLLLTQKFKNNSINFLSQLINSLKPYYLKKLYSNLLINLTKLQSNPPPEFWKTFENHYAIALKNSPDKSLLFRRIFNVAVTLKSVELIKIVIFIGKSMSVKQIDPKHDDWKPIRYNTGQLKTISPIFKSYSNKLREIIVSTRKY